MTSEIFLKKTEKVTKGILRNTIQWETIQPEKLQTENLIRLD